MSYDIDVIEEPEPQKAEEKKRLWDWLWKLRRDEQVTPVNENQRTDTPPQAHERRLSIGRRFSKRIGVGIPRSQTFSRQQDEQRQNLEPAQDKRRDLSRARSRAFSTSPHPFKKKPRRETSAPDLSYSIELPSIDARLQAPDGAVSDIQDPEQIPPPPPPPPAHPCSMHQMDDDASSQDSYGSSQTLEEEIRSELERRWILNLSMHFRDKSPREKFFITYAETPQKWRRVTVSCDYRNAEADSLEADLQAMESQREKSGRIYESLRGSLGDIQFYDTVTNLKLETQDERLHVHVTEDVNEIIAYPPSHCIDHLTQVKKYKESDLHFVEHMSGFVYKVDVGENTWIKKEIPGPDAVDEFLYEINALSNLIESENVIELKGAVVSDDGSTIKGLLIAYAEKNALVDIIYDNRSILPWQRRERWARQVIKGLSEIHEAGFVQGDFTLSNIVINGNDEVKVIDINRRGCPVGWEPPEIARLLSSGQRIAMFLGVKSDLYQLGMVLWALAMEDDEPEKQTSGLTFDDAPDEIPGYFRGLVARCLDPDPVMRPSAREMLKEFPASVVIADGFDDLPEVKPAAIIAAVPVVKSSPHRAEGPLPEPTQIEEPQPEEPQEKVQRNLDKGKEMVTMEPGSSEEKLGGKVPKYTEMLSRTAESQERLYSEDQAGEANLLGAPRDRETRSSIEPQASSRGPDGSSLSLVEAAPQPSRQTTPQKRSPERSSPARRDFAYTSSSANQVDPNIKTDATLNSPSQPSPSASVTRTYHFNPKAPAHVDSGLADMDIEATPRNSDESRRIRRSNPQQQQQQQQQQQRSRRSKDAKAGPTTNGNNNGNGDGIGNTSPVTYSARTSEDVPGGPFQHVDSGFVDMNIAYAGEGLSFKARAAHRGRLSGAGLSDSASSGGNAGVNGNIGTGAGGLVDINGDGLGDDVEGLEEEIRRMMVGDAAGGRGKEDAVGEESLTRERRLKRAFEVGAGWEREGMGEGRKGG